MSRKVINIVVKSNKQLDLFNLNLDEDSIVSGESYVLKESYPFTMTEYNEIINSNEIIAYFMYGDVKKGVRCFKSDATFDNKIHFSGISDFMMENDENGELTIPGLIIMAVTVESNQLIVELFMPPAYE